MPFFKELPKRYALFMFAAVLVNISPFLFRHVGADIWFYLVWMRCFSEQLWQGDIYPRWCMDVNDGLGTSLFLFYFPLPFYVAALFQPLISLGLSYYNLFIGLCFLSSLFAIRACYAWLRDFVEPPFALLASILFIFMPYHLETMFFRGAYSEIWCFGLLPLLFKYTRRIARGEGRGVLALAVIIGLSLLTHVPDTAEALLFGGIYILAMTGKNVWPKKEYALAAIWGFGLAAFYLVPGVFYHQFLASSMLAQGLYGWPNNFLSREFLKIPDLSRPLLASMLTMLLLAGICITVLVKRKRIADAFVRRETVAWVGLGALALFMLFPASGFMYALMGPFSKIFFPWRMQMIVAMGITYLLAVWMQFLIPPGRRKTWKLDFSLAIVCLWVVSNVMVASFSAKGDALNEQIRSAKIVFAPEYRSQWTDKEHWEYEYLLSRPDRHIPKAEVISGTGTVKVAKWGWSGIELEAKNVSGTIRLDHSYFPVWHATIDNKEPLSLFPEPKTGLILLNAPMGEHTVLLTYSAANGGKWVTISQWLSILAFAAVLWRLKAPETL